MIVEQVATDNDETLNVSTDLLEATSEVPVVCRVLEDMNFPVPL